MVANPPFSPAPLLLPNNNSCMDAEDLGHDPAPTKLGSAQVGSSWQGLGSALLVSVWLHFAWLGLARAGLAVFGRVRLGSAMLLAGESKEDQGGDACEMELLILLIKKRTPQNLRRQHIILAQAYLWLGSRLEPGSASFASARHSKASARLCQSRLGATWLCQVLPALFGLARLGSGTKPDSKAIEDCSQ